MAVLDDIKAYIRVDDDDAQVQSLIDAADGYLVNAGAVKDEMNPLYLLAIKMLVSHWYDNREPIGNAQKLAFGLSDIITQLKYCYGGDADASG